MRTNLGSASGRQITNDDFFQFWIRYENNMLSAG
jgi:hypothetical protein